MSARHEPGGFQSTVTWMGADGDADVEVLSSTLYVTVACVAAQRFPRSSSAELGLVVGEEAGVDVVEADEVQAVTRSASPKIPAASLLGRARSRLIGTRPAAAASRSARGNRTAGAAGRAAAAAWRSRSRRTGRWPRGH